MKLAIMQPYFIPYLTYFQLVDAADRFVVLDDVNFLKGGRVNRNELWISGRRSWVTLPLSRSSGCAKIRDLDFSSDARQRRKLLESVRQSYSRCLQFEAGFGLISEIFDTEEKNLSRFNLRALRLVCGHLGIEAEFVGIGELEGFEYLSGVERILKIARSQEAQTYLNLPGGRKLYGHREFNEHGIELRFVETLPEVAEYCEGGDGTGLSMIDLIMRNPPEILRRAVKSYVLRE